MFVFDSDEVNVAGGLKPNTQYLLLQNSKKKVFFPVTQFASSRSCKLIDGRPSPPPAAAAASCGSVKSSSSPSPP